MEASDKYLFDNDVVLRLGALVLTGALNYCTNLYIEKNPSHQNGYFIALIMVSLAVLWLSIVCIKTSISQDIKEIAVFELLFLAADYSLFLASRINPSQFLGLSDSLGQYSNLLFVVTYVIFIARIFWPCKNKDSNEFANWPVFGLIGIYFKLRKIEHRFAPPTVRQSVLAYGTILAASVIGFILWRNGIKNAMLTQAVPAIFILGYGCIKSKTLLTRRIGEYHEKKAEADHIKELARTAEAEAAALAKANQGLQEAVAKKETAIIYQVEFANKLQEEQARERARLEQIAADARAEGDIAKLGRLMLRIMDPKHPHHSVRLLAAIEMWQVFEEQDLSNASPQDALYAWGWENAETLGLMHSGNKSKSAVGNCAYVANWDYIGGAPKSEAKVGIGVATSEILPITRTGYRPAQD